MIDFTAPDYDQDGMGIIKVTIFQKSLKEGLNLSIYKRLASQKSDFLLFPEYFYADGTVNDHDSLLKKSQYALDWLLKLSDSYKGAIIGGTLLLQEEDRLYNACPIIYESRVVDWYRKRSLFNHEKDFVTAGSEAGVFILGGKRFSVLICNDITEPAYLTELADMGVNLIFAVMNSPRKEESADEKNERDERLLCKPARDNNFYIAKCCSTGSIFGNPVQGRSMVVTPSGISWRVSPGEEDQEILKTVTMNVPM